MGKQKERRIKTVQLPAELLEEVKAVTAKGGGKVRKFVAEAVIEKLEKLEKLQKSENGAL